jgi:hypothetical protein
MRYLNCPKCGLSVIQRPGVSSDPSCPRCRGRSGVAVPMYETEGPRPPAPAHAQAPRAA